MACRPVTNPDSLEQAVAFREMSKLHQPKVRGEPRRLWPLLTNLCKTVVAGPGLCLHFNFQATIICWAFCVALGWCYLAVTVDSDLWILGTRHFGTPRENCQLVSWGYETQQRLMWTKVHFTYWVYVISFAACLLHSIRQLRCFQRADNENKTMMDFAAFIQGLPEQQGACRTEEQLKATLEESTGQTVVNVSIAWDFGANHELVEAALKKQLRHKIGAPSPCPSQGRTDQDEPITWRKWLDDVEVQACCGKVSHADASDEDITDMLVNMTSSSNAIAVFETQRMRDRSVAACSADGGIEFQNGKLMLKEMHCEPDTVLWENFGQKSSFTHFLQICQGFGCIMAAFILWTVVFFLPYAWSVYTFNYDNGQQPGTYYTIAFTMVVVVGNSIMYEACARVSDFVQFRFSHCRETLYMMLYTIACTINVLLDLGLTYLITWEIAKGLDFRTYFGVYLDHVTDFPDRFESYAMQRVLGENAYMYAFPATFLVPFLFEPIITIWAPYKLGKIIVRCHPEIEGLEAERFLMCWPMDMGRYADIIVNVILSTVILFFPGGYTYRLFFGMVISHIWIYSYDQYKLLRCVRECNFASMEVDWWSQVLLIPCCGVILSCLVFKANTGDYGYYFEGNSIVMACASAFVAHVAVHLLMLVYVVPLFGEEERDESKRMSYENVNQQKAASWFSTNPIHCLRSDFIYRHTPPCGYRFLGKEHLLEVNEDIGCFYFDNEVSPPDDGTEDWKEITAVASTLSKHMSFRSTTFRSDK